MGKRIYIIGGDLRNRYLSEELKADGFPNDTFASWIARQESAENSCQKHEKSDSRFDSWKSMNQSEKDEWIL